MKKLGIDFFPLACIESTIERAVLSRFGSQGCYILISLLRKIYGEWGYYLVLNDDNVDDIIDRHKVKITTLDEIINFLISREYFNKELYEKYKVLTNIEIQENYYKVAERRKVVFHEMKYCLISHTKVEKNAGETEEYVSKTKENVSSCKTIREESGVEKEYTKEEEETALTQFKNEYSLKCMGFDFNKFDFSKYSIKKIFTAVKESEFLSSAKNLDLKWLLDNYERVVNGFYKNHVNSNSKVEKLANGRSYSKEELNSLFTNIDEVQI